MCAETTIEIWGGIEGTINRVRNEYFDQLEYAGHYNREGDIDLIASLGINMLRYPVLWEKHQPQKDTAIDWSFVEKNLTRLKELGIEPIAGLVHHGSGPAFVNFFDGSFEEGVAGYARLVAEKFPWLQYYTPINEPLTTARFCGLYGHWYPHVKDNLSFYKILLSECKATCMAMTAIRQVNPDAKLIQTEDLGKVYSTPLLQYQADWENERRWLSYDLLCGKVNDQHPLWNYLVHCVGLPAQDLHYFLDHPCVPDICGFNYYVNSERYLDEDLSKYPTRYHGGNERHRYADVEAVRVPLTEDSGPAVLIREAYQRLQLPIAVTECHLHCTREEQMRWFNDMWHTLNKLKAEGVNIRALTAWALFGLHGWNNLVRSAWGAYECGVFNVKAAYPKPTALVKLIQALAANQAYHHPVLAAAGWWKRDTRILYPEKRVMAMKSWQHSPASQPVLIVGAGPVGRAISRICTERNIYSRLLSTDLNSMNSRAVEKALQECTPWAVIDATVYLQGSEEEIPDSCFASSCKNSLVLARACRKHQVKLVTFFSGLPDRASTNAVPAPGEANLKGLYDHNQTPAEMHVLQVNPDALVVRTSNLFSLWDDCNFVTAALTGLKQGKSIRASDDVYVSITYVPDLVHETLTLLIDNEKGLFHITNHGRITWAGIVYKVAEMAGCDKALVNTEQSSALTVKSKWPDYSVIQHENGIKLPTWEDALQRYYEHITNECQLNAIAV